MNNVQSYSPLAAPLYYDSLASREGCEATSGNDYLGLKAYDTICVFGHDPVSVPFNQPDTVSYSVGPVSPGDPVHPYFTLWAAWVATEGVRIGRMGTVTPPADGQGVASSLYPNTVPAKISHAFNDSGLLVMAVPLGTLTEIKRYTDTAGTVARLTFPGTSCVLFNNSLLDSSIKSKAGVVAIYIRPETPSTIFARFEGEPAGAFSVERVYMPDLRAYPARLIQAEAYQRKQVLRYIDRDGRDVKLSSPLYGTEVDTETRVTLAVTLDFGTVLTAGVQATAQPSSDLLGVSPRLEYGFVYRSLIVPAPPASTANNYPLPFDKARIIVTLESGEVI